MAEGSESGKIDGSEDPQVFLQDENENDIPRATIALLGSKIEKAELKNETNQNTTIINKTVNYYYSGAPSGRGDGGTKDEPSTNDPNKSKDQRDDDETSSQTFRKVVVMFEKTSKTMRVFDPKENAQDEKEIHAITDEMIQNQYTAVVIGDDIFVLLDDGTNYKLKYIGENARWIQLQTRKVTRHDVRAVHCCGKIIAFDDWDGSSCEGEQFDLSVSFWSRIPNRPVPGCEIMIVENKGLIYCIGGLGDVTLSDVQCFNTKTRRWTKLPPLLSARYGAGATTLDGKIYVMGGRFGGYRLMSMECYDIHTQTWTALAELNRPHYTFNACMIDGKIYAVEGRYSDNTIEEYDPTKKIWSVIKVMKGQNIAPLATVVMSLPYRR